MLNQPVTSSLFNRVQRTNLDWIIYIDLYMIAIKLTVRCHHQSQFSFPFSTLTPKNVNIIITTELFLSNTKRQYC